MTADPTASGWIHASHADAELAAELRQAESTVVPKPPPAPPTSPTPHRPQADPQPQQPHSAPPLPPGSVVLSESEMEVIDELLATHPQVGHLFKIKKGATMNFYRGSRPAWAPSANPRGFNHKELAALQRWFATRPEAVRPESEALKRDSGAGGVLGVDQKTVVNDQHAEEIPQSRQDLSVSLRKIPRGPSPRNLSERRPSGGKKRPTGEPRLRPRDSAPAAEWCHASIRPHAAATRRS